jgi:glycine cleavage system transcriptional repressor
MRIENCRIAPFVRFSGFGAILLESRDMAEKEHLILTAIGPDQVGLVEKMSAFISGRGCNIEDSKMAVFCGEFAVIVLISGERRNLTRVASDLSEIEKETRLSIAVKTPSRKPAASVIPYRLTASCMDHPGIVYQISGLLRTLGVNIESMETKTYSAPVSGTPLFQLEAELAVPMRADMNELQERLADLQREQNIDIELQPSVDESPPKYRDAGKAIF